MADDVVVAELRPGVFIASRSLSVEAGSSIDVRAAVVLGERHGLVIDTMTCPENMAPILGLLGAHGRPYVVVNTHGVHPFYARSHDANIATALRLAACQADALSLVEKARVPASSALSDPRLQADHPR